VAAVPRGWQAAWSHAEQRYTYKQDDLDLQIRVPPVCYSSRTEGAVAQVAPELVAACIKAVNAAAEEEEALELSWSKKVTRMVEQAAGLRDGALKASERAKDMYNKALEQATQQLQVEGGEESGSES
jgi:hypothetical protein